MWALKAMYSLLDGLGIGGAAPGGDEKDVAAVLSKLSPMRASHRKYVQGLRSRLIQEALSQPAARVFDGSWPVLVRHYDELTPYLQDIVQDVWELDGFLRR